MYPPTRRLQQRSTFNFQLVPKTAGCILAFRFVSVMAAAVALDSYRSKVGALEYKEP